MKNEVSILLIGIGGYGNSHLSFLLEYEGNITFKLDGAVDLFKQSFTGPMILKILIQRPLELLQRRMKSYFSMLHILFPKRMDHILDLNLRELM